MYVRQVSKMMDLGQSEGLDGLGFGFKSITHSISHAVSNVGHAVAKVAQQAVKAPVILATLTTDPKKQKERLAMEAAAAGAYFAGPAVLKAAGGLVQKYGPLLAAKLLKQQQPNMTDQQAQDAVTQAQAMPADPGQVAPPAPYPMYPPYAMPTQYMMQPIAAPAPAPAAPAPAAQASAGGSSSVPLLLLGALAAKALLFS